MKSVIVRSERATHVFAPRRIFAAGQMATIDAMLERFLPQLLRFQNTRIRVPAIALPLSDIWTLIAINIGRGEPSRASTLVHVNAVMVVGKLVGVLIVPSVGPHLRRIALHLGANCRQWHVHAIQEIRIVPGTITVVLIDNDSLFSGLDFGGNLRFRAQSLSQNGRRRQGTDRDADAQWNDP